MRSVYFAVVLMAAVAGSSAHAADNLFNELAGASTVPLATLLSACIPGSDTCFKPAGVVAGGAVLMFLPARALTSGGVRPGQMWFCSVNRRGQNVCRNVAPSR